MEKRILSFKEIIDGNWSSTGNFLGKCDDGDVVHIYKNQMETFGFQRAISDAEKFTDKVKLPLFVLAYNKQFINKNNEQVVRLTAVSIWRTYKDLIDALLIDRNLETEIEIDLEMRHNEIKGKESQDSG